MSNENEDYRPEYISFYILIIVIISYFDRNIFDLFCRL